MKSTSLLLSAVVLFAFSSCTDSPAENAIEKERSEQVMRDAGSADSVNAETAIPSASETGTAQVIAAPAPATEQATAAAPVPNPPHGQPGHVCDAPTGNAPSVVNSMAQPSTAPLPVTAAQPMPNSGGGRLNPEHGQPGHVCGISVGEPLP